MDPVYILSAAISAVTTVGVLWAWERTQARRERRRLRRLDNVEFVRRPDTPAAKPSRTPGVKGHARVTEAHMSQPRSYWNPPVED